MKYLSLLLFIWTSHCIGFASINDLTFTSLDLSCPGVKLVASCGNGVCEGNEDENILNCPADCSPAAIRSYNHEVLCESVQEIKRPQTREEVQDIIRYAIFKRLKVKPVGALHSASEVICTDGIAVPMRDMNQIDGIEEVQGKKVVSVGPGVTVFELSEWLYKRGYSLKGMPNMGFRDVTVAGAVATGSHGSSAKHSAVISNIVEAVEVVDGLGRVQYVERGDSNGQLIKALSVNLGLMGIVTKLKFAVREKFNLKVSMSYHNDEGLFSEEGLISQVKDCDYGQMMWFPGEGRYVKMCGVETKDKIQRGANNILLNPAVPGFIATPFKQYMQMGVCFNPLMCMLEKIRFANFFTNPPLEVEGRFGRKITRKIVTGPVHNMISSHFTKHAGGLFQMDWEIAVPQSRAQEALAAIKKLLNDNNICPSLIGLFIRFAPIESKTFMAHTVAGSGDWKEGDVAVYFELPIYLPIGLDAATLAEYERPYLEYAELLINQFSGRPHWGKNRSWVFPLVTSNGSYEKLSLFKNWVKKYDPMGIFRNDFSSSIGLSF